MKPRMRIRLMPKAIGFALQAFQNLVLQSQNSRPFETDKTIYWSSKILS